MFPGCCCMPAGLSLWWSLRFFQADQGQYCQNERRNWGSYSSPKFCPFVLRISVHSLFLLCFDLLFCVIPHSWERDWLLSSCFRPLIMNSTTYMAPSCSVKFKSDLATVYYTCVFFTQVLLSDQKKLCSMNRAVLQ